jgi:hypothetical protein
MLASDTSSQPEADIVLEFQLNCRFVGLIGTVRLIMFSMMLRIVIRYGE